MIYHVYGYSPCTRLPLVAVMSRNHATLQRLVNTGRLHFFHIFGIDLRRRSSGFLSAVCPYHYQFLRRNYCKLFHIRLAPSSSLEIDAGTPVSDWVMVLATYAGNGYLVLRLVGAQLRSFLQYRVAAHP